MFVLAALVAALCTCSRNESPDRFGLTADHYKIIDKAIYHAVSEGAQGKWLIVTRAVKHGSFPMRSSDRREADDALYRGAQLDAYVDALRARGDLAVSRDSMVAEYRRTGTYGEYKGITVSPIGFDQSGGTAAIYCAWSCGNLCGYGMILFFKKEGKKWVPFGEILIWVS